jgi:hypothetical protein
MLLFLSPSEHVGLTWHSGTDARAQAANARVVAQLFWPVNPERDVLVLHCRHALDDYPTLCDKVVAETPAG